MIYLNEDTELLNVPRTWSDDTITIATPLETIQAGITDTPFSLSDYAALLGVSEDDVQKLFGRYYIKAKAKKQGVEYTSEVTITNGLYQMFPSVSAEIQAGSIVQFVKYTNTDNETFYTVLFVR